MKSFESREKFCEFRVSMILSAADSPVKEKWKYFTCGPFKYNFETYDNFSEIEKIKYFFYLF